MDKKLAAKVAGIRTELLGLKIPDRADADSGDIFLKLTQQVFKMQETLIKIANSCTNEHDRNVVEEVCYDESDSSFMALLVKLRSIDYAAPLPKTIKNATFLGEAITRVKSYIIPMISNQLQKIEEYLKRD